MNGDFGSKAALGVAHDNIVALRMQADKLSKLVDHQEKVINAKDAAVAAATQQLRASENTVRVLVDRVKQLETAQKEKVNVD